MARPKENFKPQDYAVLADSRGVSERTIARAVGMSYSAFRKAKARDKRAQEALTRGRGEEETALVGSLFKAATAEKRPHVVAAIFLLKARHNYIDQPQPQLPENKVEITFQLPAPLSREQYAKVVEAVPKRKLIAAGVDTDAA